LSNLAASSRRIIRISSVGVGIIFGLQQLFWGANDGRFEAAIATHRRNPILEHGVRDMFEVPRHQVLYTIDRRNRDMECVTRLTGRNGPVGDQFVSQIINGI